MREDQFTRLISALSEIASLVRESARIQDRDALRVHGSFNEQAKTLYEVTEQLRALAGRIADLDGALGLERLISEMPDEVIQVFAERLDRPTLDRIRMRKWQIEREQADYARPELPAHDDKPARKADDDTGVFVRVLGREVPIPVMKLGGFVLRYVLPGTGVGLGWHFLMDWIHTHGGR